MKTQKAIGTVKMFRVSWSVLMFFAILLAAQQAGAAVIFEDNFDSSTLAPEWLISPGKGSYSLTANPGYLRYTIDAYHTNRDGSGGYDKVLWLVLPFYGDQWVLQTAVTYNLRPGQPTNNRTMTFIVKQPGMDGTWMADTQRCVGVNDDYPGSNALFLESGPLPTWLTFPNSSGPLTPDRWYYEIERNIDHITIRASNDGDDSTFEYQHDYTFPAGYLVNGHQEIEIWGQGWWGSNNPPGYVDIDYIRIVPEPATILLLGLGSLAIVRKQRAKQQF